MPQANKILKYHLEERVLALSASGKTTLEIAEQLSIDLGDRDSISQPSVSRWLKSVRQERSEATRQIVHEHLKATVPADLDAMDEVEGWLLSQFRGLGNPITDEEIHEAYLAFVLKGSDGADLAKSLVRWAENKLAGTVDIRMTADLGMRVVKIIETKLRFSGILEDPNAVPGDAANLVDLEDFRADLRAIKKGAACG